MTLQFRPCHLETDTLDAAVDWIETHRRLWEERFEKLDTHLRSVLERERGRNTERRPEHPAADPGSNPSPDRKTSTARKKSVGKRGE